MTYQVFARKWRPKKFQEVIGQSHITVSLQNTLLKNKMGHAYLFTGTRGVGKTTVARIFAKAIRCQNRASDANPCGMCNSCKDFDTGTSLNFLEIDGASNNQVDNVRDLISNVQYLPTIGKYKIYIIDEVHMLSISAFNALLKTLEEPPKHAIFILATTGPHKLPGTVLSRCQRFDFRTVSLPVLMKHILKISQAEGIGLETQDVLKQICLQGRGSVRDTLSILDQVLSYSVDNYIDEKTLSESLGLARGPVIKDMARAIMEGDVKTCTLRYKQLIAENVFVKNILFSILDTFYEIIEKLSKVSEDAGKENGPCEEVPTDVSITELFWLYETFAKDTTWIVDSLWPEKVTLIVLQKLCLRRTFFTGDCQSHFIKKTLVTSKSTPIINEKKEAEYKEEDKRERKNVENVENVENVFLSTKKEESKDWDGFLEFLSNKSRASASNLEQGNLISPLEYDGKKLKIDLGLGITETVFLEYLQDTSVYNNLLSNLSDYFSCPLNNITFKLSSVDDTTKEKLNFLSKAEIEKRKEEERINTKRDELLSDSLIIEAEKMFNSKIDKVIVDE